MPFVIKRKDNLIPYYEGAWFDDSQEEFCNHFTTSLDKAAQYRTVLLAENAIVLRDIRDAEIVEIRAIWEEVK